MKVHTLGGTQKEYNPEQIATYFSVRLNQELSDNPSGQAYARCPLHNDNDPSFSVNLNNGLWTCHAGCGSGNMEQFERRFLERCGEPFAGSVRDSIDNVLRGEGALDEFEEPQTGTQSHQPTKTVYPYRDANGTVLYEIVRTDFASGGKKFLARH